MSDTVIRIAHLGKRYRLGTRGGYKTIRESISRSARTLLGTRSTQSPGAETEKGYQWALRDVSVDIREGETVGIIGRNGAGKSTLLKVLSKITRPTCGTVEIRGRVGSLLEVGTGFHPELTGHENVYLYGAILGMNRWEITRKYDEIVEFAGLSEFMETPVKRYSSGMYMRLAFAVAAHLEPEILLVDEVLAVGDAEFQKRCLGKMQSVANQGRTVLFVSHNMAAVGRLCKRTVLLTSGTASYWENTADAIAHYQRGINPLCTGYADLRNASGWDSKRTVIATDISTHSEDGLQQGEFRTGDSLMVTVGYSIEAPLPSAYCQLNFFDSTGERLMTLCSLHQGASLRLSGTGSIECTLHDIRLPSGEYFIDVEIGRALPRREWLDYVPHALSFSVELGDYLAGVEVKRGQGIIAQRSQWRTACR